MLTLLSYKSFLGTPFSLTSLEYMWTGNTSRPCLSHLLAILLTLVSACRLWPCEFYLWTPLPFDSSPVLPVRGPWQEIRWREVDKELGNSCLWLLLCREALQSPLCDSLLPGSSHWSLLELRNFNWTQWYCTVACCVCSSFSRVQLCHPWTVAHLAPLSMEFSRQKYWRGLPFPSPGDLPNPGIKPLSPVLQADSLPAELPGKPTCL